MAQIKAIFFDIDGTLVSFRTRTVPPSAVKALKAVHEKGIRLFVASGRPLMFVQSCSEQLEGLPFDGYVLTNGQCCTDAFMSPFYVEALPRRAVAELVDWLEDNPDVVARFVEQDYSYLNRITPEYRELMKERPAGLEPVEDPHRAIEHSIEQINPYLSAEREKEMMTHLHGVKTLRWNDVFSDMVPEDGGKDVGIRRMLDRFGLDRAETMAFGDGGNDISMLQFCGIGVAMGNAKDDVKAAADYVTDDIEQDGVAKALRHFGLL